MKDKALIRELASCPPNVWAQRLRQAAIIDPLLFEGATSQNIAAASAQLGVTRRRVRQLMGFARDRKLGVRVRGHSTGSGIWLADEKESLIEEALDLVGDNASLKTVCDLIADLGEERQIALPSTVTIRHRFNAKRLRRRSIAHLQLARSRTLDLAPLGLSVIDSRRQSQTAWLLASFDSETAQVIDYALFCGRPTPFRLSQTIRSFVRYSPELQCFGATNAVLEALYLAPNLPGYQIVKACSSRRLSAGAVIRSVYGLRIGKIKLRADTRSLRVEVMDPVSVEVARHVLASLLSSGPER